MAVFRLGWYGINGGKVLAGKRESDDTPSIGVTVFDVNGDPVDMSGGDEAAAQAAVQGVAAITPSNTVAVDEGRGFLVICTVAGNVKVKFVDDSELTFPLDVGLAQLPWAIKQVFVTGTTATATYFNLL